MKLTSYFAAFAGFGFVTASPAQTSPHPPGHKPLVFWEPESAYENLSPMKEQWQEKCEEALHRAGCGVGIIYKGQPTLTKPNGEMATYMNVEGAPLTDMESLRKLRVFDDGSSQHGWSAQDRVLISQLKNPEKQKDPAAAGQNAHLVWHPAVSNHIFARKRLNWEKRCNQALTREGCGYGLIHRGENTSIKNGKKTFYVHVEGRPSMDVGPTHLMKVFNDASSEHVDTWSMRDRRAISQAKRPGRSFRPGHPHVGPSGPVLVWDPADTYKAYPNKRSSWEDRCVEALTREGCRHGVIHKGENKPSGEKTTYLLVEGRPSADVEPVKKMRVFDDGSSKRIADWNWWERRAILQAKRPSKPLRPQLPDTKKEPSGSRLTWDPADAYAKRPLKRLFWEQRCDEALMRSECLGGIIHKGETKWTKPDGGKTSYLKVEGLSSMDLGHTKLKRVFQDGTSADGWSDRDRQLMASAKRSRGPDRAWLMHAFHRVEASTSTQTPDQQSSKHRIDWDPPDAYGRDPFLRKSYQEACQKALEREGCDIGIIHQGHHRMTNPDGTKTSYMNVSTGKHDDPHNAKYMRLFEDGSSWWYPPGSIPKKDLRRYRKGAQLGNPSIESTRKRLKEQGSGTSPQAPTQEYAQDSSKRRRIRGGE